MCRVSVAVAPEAIVHVPDVQARAIARMLIVLEERRAKFAVEMAVNGRELEHKTSEARPGDTNPPTYQSTFDELDAATLRLRDAFPDDVWQVALQLAQGGLA